MKKMFLTLTCSLILSVSCAAQQQNEQAKIKIEESAVRGQIRGVPDGEVIFTQAPKGSGVQMIVNVSGIKKPGFHAIHIHEKPICDGNFTSAGGHYNPDDKPHGHPEESKHHIGDLGNFRSSATGSIVESRVYKHLSMNPNSQNYVGNRALIIHSKADDYSTQPTGGAGSRIGCAILQNTAE
ncbi:MAG: superoxide dismutase family protein [Bacteriovoracaceae bacterium]|nr:superoxide dismutase family protein [Bacteriovoracaceae bacterium]